MVLSEVGGKSSARGACRDGTPSAEERKENEYKDTRSLER